MGEQGDRPHGTDGEPRPLSDIQRAFQPINEYEPGAPRPMVIFDAESPFGRTIPLGEISDSERFGGNEEAPVPSYVLDYTGRWHVRDTETGQLAPDRSLDGRDRMPR